MKFSTVLHLIVTIETDGVEGQLGSGLNEKDGSADPDALELDDVHEDGVLAEDDPLRGRLEKILGKTVSAEIYGNIKPTLAIFKFVLITINGFKVSQ
jgi:hypothetical protein